jgi:hypothetical protein
MIAKDFSLRELKSIRDHETPGHGTTGEFTSTPAASLSPFSKS